VGESSGRIGKTPELDTELADVLVKLGEGLALVANKDQLDERVRLDPSQIFVYSKLDLERAKRDLGEVVGMLTMLRTYLNPYFPDDAAPQDMRWSTRKDALEWMSGLRPFQEALVRVKARNKNARPDV